jgi:ParB family chromosome partitioning protein
MTKNELELLYKIVREATKHRIGDFNEREAHLLMKLEIEEAVKRFVEKDIKRMTHSKHTEKPKVHCLKTWPEIFKPMASGVKTFDYREDDRGFKVGDALVLQEWDPKLEDYTGEMVTVWIDYIMHGNQFGVPEGYVVMSVTRQKED